MRKSIVKNALKKKSAVIIAVIISVLFVSGCGKSSGVSNNDVLDTSEVSTREETTVDTHPFDITMTFTGDINIAEGEPTTKELDKNNGDITKCISPELIKYMKDADITLVNNEFCYSDRGAPLANKMWTFRAGPERAKVLNALGVDVAQLANKRQGTQKAKTRSEVSGGGRKPWRQKGTGHARQGSTRAPQWKGGGVVFAPTPRDYTIRLNKKEKRAALKSALTSRVQENKFIVVEELKFNEIKTKNFKNVLNNLKVNKALVVLSESDENAVLSARNIADVKTAQVGTINVYDILKYNTVVASKAAVASIEEVYA